VKPKLGTLSTPSDDDCRCSSTSPRGSTFTRVPCTASRRIAAEEGLAKGLYKGFLANVVRSVGGALVLVFYDRAKNSLGL